MKQTQRRLNGRLEYASQDGVVDYEHSRWSWSQESLATIVDPLDDPH